MTAPARTLTAAEAALTEEQAHHWMRLAHAYRNLAVAISQLMTNPADVRLLTGVRRAVTRLNEALTALEPPRQRKATP